MLRTFTLLIKLKNNQNQFPIPLTEVVGRQLFITDFGKEIAIAAEKILNEVHAINYKTLAGKLSSFSAEEGEFNKFKENFKAP
jgi:hypothetical protein